MPDPIKVKIIGAGPTGLLLAHALNKVGCIVTLYDLQCHEELIDRNRAYALTHSSITILKDLDLWDILKTNINSFNSLVIRDNVIRSQVNFSRDDIPFNLRNSKSVGWVVEHKFLVKQLISYISQESNVYLKFGQKASNQLEGNDFVIAANGIFSHARFQAGIKDWKIKYNKGCLSAKVLLRGADSNKAYEILRKEGPFAVLPIGEDVFQIVCSSNLKTCKEMANLSTSLLMDRITSFLPHGIQADCLFEQVNVYPNYFFIARTFYKNKFILAGEAAHSFHPVGGQGLNLCWRDVHILKNLFGLISVGKITPKLLPPLYYILRIVDVIAIGLATDFLLRIFSNNFRILLPIRKFLFYLLSRSKIIRKVILSIMTNGISLQ